MEEGVWGRSRKSNERWKRKQGENEEFSFVAPLLNIHTESIFDAFGRCLSRGGKVSSYSAKL